MHGRPNTRLVCFLRVIKRASSVIDGLPGPTLSDDACMIDEHLDGSFISEVSLQQ